jgi:hypothetical protein
MGIEVHAECDECGHDMGGEDAYCSSCYSDIQEKLNDAEAKIEELEEEYREPLQWELNRGSAYIVLKDGRDDEFFIKGQEQEAVECLLADLYHNQYNDKSKIPSYIILDKETN